MEFTETDTGRVWLEYFWPAVGSIMLFGIAMMGFNVSREHRLRKAAEREARQRLTELSQLNRRATVGELSVAIAHELNQPLGAIMNNVEAAEFVLQSSPVKSIELKEILDDIRRDDQRAHEIIRRLRALVVGNSGEFAVFEFNDAVRGAVHLCSSTTGRKGISVHQNLVECQLPVYGDEIQLQQVVINLIMNCIDAIEVSKSTARDIVINTAAGSEGTAKFSISDSGPGIPVGKLLEIFEPFYTTKAGGMGIGLSLSRSIVEHFGGRIWAENADVGGAIFHFQLPMSSEGVAHHATGDSRR